MSAVGDPRCVAASANVCGEGAVWHQEENCLYWTDINQRLVQRTVPGSGTVQRWRFDEPATALALTDRADRMLLVLGGSIVLWSAGTDECELLHRLPDWPSSRCNDARVSPAGSLWFGTMQNNVGSGGATLPVTEHRGCLFSLHGSGEVQQWDRGFGISNTVCWNGLGDTLLFGDTLANAIYRYDYSAARDAVLSPRRDFFHGFERGLPDGSAMDAEGCLWNCRYGGGCVVRIAPDGQVCAVLEMPVWNPTTCAFGGPEMRTLFITSARQESSAGENDGGVFAVELDVPGLEQPRFRTAATDS